MGTFTVERKHQEAKKFGRHIRDTRGYEHKLAQALFWSQLGTLTSFAPSVLRTMLKPQLFLGTWYISASAVLLGNEVRRDDLVRCNGVVARLGAFVSNHEKDQGEQTWISAIVRLFVCIDQAKDQWEEGDMWEVAQCAHAVSEPLAHSKLNNGNVRVV